MERVTYLVLGGGVTGLSFANFVDAKDYLVLEKERALGGYCKSTHKEGFVWDCAGHYFHFRNAALRDYLLARMPPGSVREIIRDARIRYKDNLIDFPFQTNIHQLPREEFLDCLYDLYFRAADRSCRSFQDMVYTRFGRNIAEKFLVPYNRKLYACDLDTLDADAMGRFFPQTTMDDVIRNFKVRGDRSYNATFLYPEAGAAQFVTALVHDLDPSRLVIGERALGIDPDDKVVEIAGRRVRYQYLISTVPFPDLLNLMSWPADASCLTWSKVLVFNLGFDAKGPQGIHWIYFPEEKYRFYRVGFYDNLLGAGRMSLYVEIGLAQNDEVDPGREREAVLRGLEEAGIVQGQNLVCSETILLDPAYVHVSGSAQRFFEETDRLLRSKDIYSIGRYGGWKYCSLEDNLLEAKALAGDFNRAQAKLPWDVSDAG
ncbi:MAG: NAD(P)-binding protein [Planctomycetes bacterium]|nr:NAD(P)-binding protein [Planctomycetota bacterium]